MGISQPLKLIEGKKRIWFNSEKKSYQIMEEIVKNVTIPSKSGLTKRTIQKFESSAQISTLNALDSV